MKLIHLLLGRQADKPRQNIKNQRHVTLTTKVRLVKPMVFPVVMFGCEHWTTNELWCWEDSCESLGLQGGQTSPS